MIMESTIEMKKEAHEEMRVVFDKKQSAEVKKEPMNYEVIYSFLKVWCFCSELFLINYF